MPARKPITEHETEMVVITEDNLPLPTPDITWTQGVYRGGIVTLSPILDSTGTTLLYYQLPNGDLVHPSDILAPPAQPKPAK